MNDDGPVAHPRRVGALTGRTAWRGAVRLAVVGAVTVAMVACSGDEADPAADPAETTTASTAVSTTGDTAGTTTAAPVATTPPRDGTEVCAAFDPAAVEEALGGPLLEPPRVDSLAPTCAFLVADGIVYVRLLGEDGDTVDTAEAHYAEESGRMVEFGAEAETIDGLGDEAEMMALADGTELVLVRAGPVVFNVDGEGIAAEDLLAIAEQLVAGIG